MLLSLWFFTLGLMAVLVVIVLIVILLFSKGENLGDVVYLYEKVIPVTEDVVNSLEESLREKGLLAVKFGELIVISDFVYWEFKPLTSDGRAYLNIRSGVKTWYFILTIILLVFFLILGILLGIFAYWKFINVRDKVKWMLAEKLNDPTIANML